MMTFSEDDLLPYRRLRYVHTAEYFKTVFMQWTMLDATLQETGGFVTGIHPDTLSQMSVLDMSDSVSDSYYHSQDFAASFEQVVNGTDHESQQRAARRLELGPLLYNLFKAEIPGMAEMSAEVEKLIDEELKGATIPEAVRIKANVRSKARIVRFVSASRGADFILGCCSSWFPSQGEDGPTQVQQLQ